jgi:hypothetical protein
MEERLGVSDVTGKLPPWVEAMGDGECVGLACREGLTLGPNASAESPAVWRLFGFDVGLGETPTGLGSLEAGVDGDETCERLALGSQDAVVPAGPTSTRTPTGNTDDD